MRFPHFDFYPGDWVGDAHNRYLSLAEKGAHLELLCMIWNDASETTFGIIDDTRGISRALGITSEEWQQMRAVLIEGPYAVLKIMDGRIISPRLYQEWEKTCERSHKARESRSHRSNNERSTNVDRSNDERTNERSTSHQAPGTRHQAPREKTKIPAAGKPPTVYSEDFETFWTAYPRKKEKAAAWKAWQTRIKDGVQPLDLITAANHYSSDCVRNHTEPRFIKHAKSFLGPTRPFEDWILTPTMENAATRASPSRPYRDVIAENADLLARRRAQVDAQGG